MLIEARIFAIKGTASQLIGFACIYLFYLKQKKKKKLVLEKKKKYP